MMGPYEITVTASGAAADTPQGREVMAVVKERLAGLDDHERIERKFDLLKEVLPEPKPTANRAARRAAASRRQR